MRVKAAISGALLALVLAVGPTSAKDRALVIGVNHYPDILVGGVPGQKDLGGAVFDAQTFTTLLQSQFHVAEGDIHTLTDAAATRQAILDEFQSWLLDDTGPGDRVFFYFAGHGSAVRVSDATTGVSRMTSAIVPSDASGDLTKQPLDIKGLILGVDLRRLLDRLEDRTVMVVADSCQSGSVSRDINHPFVVPPGIRVRTLTPSGAVGMTTESFAADTDMRREVKREGRLLDIQPETAASDRPSGGAKGSLSVWSAATTDQVTFDLNDRPGGVFTQNFADGLRDKKAAPSGVNEITAGALLNYVRDEAKTFCVSAGPACSAGLTPQLVAPPAYLSEPLLASRVSEGQGQAAPGPVSLAQAAPDQVTPAQAPQSQEPAKKDATGPQTAQKLTSLLSHTNDFGLSVTILPGSSVRIGQAIQFRVVSEEAGKVVVFDLTPDGDLTQIFPNVKTDRVGRIRANAPLTMPDPYWGINFKVHPPAGPGTLLVLVTEDAFDLSKATSGALDFKPIQRTSRLLQVIGAEVQKPVVSAKLDEPTREARWAFVRVPYTVTP